MLFWEALGSRRRRQANRVSAVDPFVLRSARLPYDKRCVAMTRQGRRCRGRICQGREFCSFHDPEVSQHQRRRNAANGGRRRAFLSHIPDGYLRKLTDRKSIGHAMDRLYREVRIGSVTPEMGQVLLSILDRLLHSNLDETLNGTRNDKRCKVDRVRPKLKEVLTRSERADWRHAAKDAPAAFLQLTPRERAEAGMREEQTRVAKAIPAAS